MEDMAIRATKFVLNKYKRENIRKVATIYNATDLSIPRSFACHRNYTTVSLLFIKFYILRAPQRARMKFLRG